MKNIKYIAFAVPLLFAVGCATSSKTQVNPQDENLKTTIAQLQQNLADEKAAHQKDVEKLRAESNEMQTQAMNSITTMLSKDKAVQDKLQAQVNELTAQNSQLQAEVKTLKSASPVPQQ